MLVCLSTQQRCVCNPGGLREGLGGATLWLEDGPAASTTLAGSQEGEGDEPSSQREIRNINH